VLGARRTDRLEKLAAEIRTAGDTAEYRTLDVTNLADVQAFADFALKKFSKIDVTINLAQAGRCPRLAAAVNHPRFR